MTVRKIVLLVFVTLMVVLLAGCDININVNWGGGSSETVSSTASSTAVILNDSEHDYYAVGQFNSWTAADSDYEMTSIAYTDSRISSIEDEASNASVLYIVSVSLSSDNAGWASTFTIDGVETTLNGSLSIKVIQTDAGDSDSINFWAQNYESGEVHNLTNSTLFIPEYVETSATGGGTWADNPFAFIAGDYYLVWAIIDGAYYMGLISQ